MNNLKPCPFCGSQDVDTTMDCMFGNFYVKCFNCYAVIPEPSSTNYTEKEAIEAWNRRVNDETD